MTQTTAERVAGTVRAEMARSRVSNATLKDALNLSYPAVARRLSGDVPFDVDELAVIADLLNVTAASLIEDAA